MSKIESNIQTANTIGNLFNSWIRIAIIFGSAIISCGIAYMKIFDNEKDIALEKSDRIKQEAIIEERADKRYLRAMETAKELKDYIKYQEERLLEMEKKQSSMEGYIKGKEYQDKK